jgi:chromate transporter
MTLPTLSQLIAYFLRLGCIGFGGPPAHIAMMRNELVEKRAWVSAEQFEADLATANLLPGPTSTEMTIYIGYRLRGGIGAILSGVSFILPAFVFVLLISMAYVRYGNVVWLESLLYATKPVALVLVIYGTWQLGKSILNDWREICVFVLSLTLLSMTRIDILLAFVIGGCAMIALKFIRGRDLSMFVLDSRFFGSVLTTDAPSQLNLLLAFLKIGAVLYGGGFALIGVLQQELVVSRGWLTQQQLLDGIAIGQSTPGPVFTTATFVGFLVGGFIGAVIATIGIFIPAFVFVLAESKLLSWIKRSELFRIFLRGVNATVVASILLAAIQLGQSAIFDLPTLVIAVASFIALWCFHVDAHWLVLMAIGIGVARMIV